MATKQSMINIIKKTHQKYITDISHRDIHAQRIRGTATRKTTTTVSLLIC